MSTRLNSQVKAFHIKFGHPVNTRPAIPPEEQVRFRLKLITEEYFELLDATFDSPFLRMLHDKVIEEISTARVDIDLPEFVDAQGDLDFVNEGTRIVFGVDGDLIGDEIYRANMDKDAVYVQTKDGYHKGSNIKPTKPEAWRPPQIEDELRRQGWKG